MAAKTARRTRKPLTDAEIAARKEARAARTAMMAEVSENFEVDEDSASMVKAFDDLTTHYSEGNALLILGQAAAQGRKVRGLRDVGGFNAFAERGRSIKKGEHQSIFIWARVAKVEEGDEERTTVNADGAKVRSFYRVMGIFHYSQTEDKAKADARRAAEKAAALAAK